MTDRGNILVVSQFVCLSLLIYHNGFVVSWIGAQLIQAAAVVLGIWSVSVMSKSKLSIHPQPKAESTLIKGGPYAVIRHPMYTCLILYTGAMLFDFSTLNIALFLWLCGTFMLKIQLEEKLLMEAFNQHYEAYQKHTWKLLPYIY